MNANSASDPGSAPEKSKSRKLTCSITGKEYARHDLVQLDAFRPSLADRIPYKQTVVLLFRRGPAPDASVGSLERSGAAAAGNMAGTDDGDAAVIADGAGGPARADTSAEAFADDLAAAHDYRRRAAAGTGRAGGDDDPRPVEISAPAAPATTTASSRGGSSRLLCFGLASPCGPFGFRRA